MKYPIKRIGIKHLDWVALILETDLPSYSKMLAMYLSGFMNRDRDMAWPSLARIQSELSLTRGTVCKYLNVLEEEGWINREKGNFKTTTRYYVRLPEILENEIKGVEENLGSIGDALGSARDALGVVHHTDRGSAPHGHKSIIESPNVKSTINIETDRFEDFWAIYPKDRRKYKPQCKKVWQKKKLDLIADQIIADVLNRIENDDQWKDGFHPGSKKYLDNDCWQEDICVRKKKTNEYDQKMKNLENKFHSFDDLVKTDRQEKLLTLSVNEVDSTNGRKT